MKRLAVAWLTLVAALASAQLPAAASDYSDGVALYKQKNYRAAAAKFEAAMKANPRDANTIYYCALAEQLANNRGRARQLYEYLVTNFSSSPVAAMAQTGLSQLGGGASSALSATTGRDSSSAASSSGSVSQGEPDYLRNVPDEVKVPLIRHGNSKAAYLEVQINGRPIVFHLDTGAHSTMIGENQMEQLGMGRPADARQFEIGGVGEEKVKGWLQKADMKVATIYKRDVPIMVSEHYDSEPLLGQDFLGDFNTTIDDSSGQIVFRKRTASPRITARGTIDIPFKIDPDGRHMLVDTLVNGKPYVMIFDTGADSVCFTFNDFKKLGILTPDGPPAGISRGVKGDTPTWLVSLDSLKVGKVNREGFQVSLISDATMEHPLLGQSFFGGYKYTVDRSAHVIHLVEPD